ncbi:hypothetical protein SCB49_09850 [unidentified eubacterium SCB49]|nr:hypothetical protein SCB49_09850 [unidentified eubacterium SCB49]
MERKFERKVKQTNPTNPSGIVNQTNTNKFEPNTKTIKEQQNK